MGIKINVIFLGFRHNHELAQALQANDVFVTMSKSENMPLSILEAMAIGLPVVAVNALGIPEIVKNNINGFLVSPDNPQEMANKILELIKDEELLKKFSRASRKLALNYSQERIAESLLNTYQNLVNKKQ